MNNNTFEASSGRFRSFHSGFVRVRGIICCCFSFVFPFKNIIINKSNIGRGDQDYVLGDPNYVSGGQDYVLGDPNYVSGDQDYVSGDPNYVLGY